MSPRKSNKAAVAAPAGPYRKPRADLYTVLLVLSLIAILIGILFLYLEQETYEFKFKGETPVAMLSYQRSAFSDRQPAIGVAARTAQARPLCAFLIPNP